MFVNTNNNQNINNGKPLLTRNQLIALAILAAGVGAGALIYTGFSQYHFQIMDLQWLTTTNTWVSSLVIQRHCTILLQYDFSKTLALMAGGGVLAGAAAFGIKVLATNKIEKSMEDKTASAALSKRRLHLLDSGFSIACLTAASILLAYSLHYLFMQTPAFNTVNIFNKVIGYNQLSTTQVGWYVWIPGIYNASNGFIAGCALGIIGILGACHRMSKNMPEHKIVPINDFIHTV